MYFNVNFNVFFKLIKVHLLVSEPYIHQNARCKDKNYYSHIYGYENILLCICSTSVEREGEFDERLTLSLKL